MTYISNQSELDSDMDGVLNLVELNGQSSVTKNYLDSDLYSPASGKARKKTRGGLGAFLKNSVKGVGGTIKNTLSKAQANRALKLKGKFGAKQTEALSKLETAKALAKQDDSKLIAALNQAPAEPTKKGLSTGAWVGIGAGVLLLIGGITFMVMRKKK